jgi:ABC-type dipeptide/oligopeptide/nickel transport system ATPase component
MVAATNGALLQITHDLRAASVLCQDALVIEAGRLVDRSPIAGLLEGSRAPATRTLAQAALALSR